MPGDTAVTVGGLLRRAAARLGEAGVPAARREALRLWADLTGEAAGAALADPGRAVSRGRAEALEAWIERRAAGEPLAYVTGLTGFRRLALASDRRALIPRPETEGLVDLLLSRASGGVVADVGTGSGCLALALADEGRFDSVLAVDRSSAALALAAENRRRTGLPIRLVRADLTSAFGPASLDALVSNPPYLAEPEYDALDPSVRAWEPAEALVSGVDGLEATTRLLADAARVVRGGGWIALEVDATRAAAAAWRAATPAWEQVTIHEDLYGRERYLLAQRSMAQ